MTHKLYCLSSGARLYLLGNMLPWLISKGRSRRILQLIVGAMLRRAPDFVYAAAAVV
jgi:hypothetical protein